MADYTIINATNAELTNVNVGGVDVPANSVGQDITLTSAELATVAAIAGVAVLKDDTTYQERRNVARILKYRKPVTL